MVNYKDEYEDFEKQFGISDSENLISQIEEFIKKSEIDIETKSKALSLIGSIICYQSPFLRDDCGYSYFKEALKLNCNNYDAILGICSIFNTYPYPFNTIVTEVDFLDYIDELLEDFEFLDERNKFNTLETIRSYSTFRKKIIDKYGYSFT